MPPPVATADLTALAPRRATTVTTTGRSWGRRLPDAVDLEAATTGGTVAVVGLGYVGLPTALSLLEAGSRVIGLDVSARRLDAVVAGDVDLLPDDLERLRALSSSPRLELTDDAARLAAADTVVVCVPTPVTEQLVPDLRALSGACAAVAAHVRAGATVVLTSTTYVGCTREMLCAPLAARGLVPGTDVHVAFSPERIDPGVVGRSPATTPRVVGGLTPACTERASAALARTCPSVHPVSSPEAAEMTKLLENTFRAVNIAMVNEFADVAGAAGIDVMEVIDAAATKPYGFMRFTPGAGVGGHCIPCDPHYLLWQLRGHRTTAPVIEAAMTGVAARPGTVVRRLREELAARAVPLAGARVHVVGAAYKPGVADVRESPALEVMAACAREGATVTYTDPHVDHLDLVHAVGRVGGPTRTLALTSVAPAEVAADIVLLHTRHPGEDLAWLAELSASGTAVLDATYRAHELPDRAVV